ncbi:MAG: SpoIIE family protein phosphatase, partial [Bacteroidota bacterium]
LKQKENDNVDGMDMGLCRLHRDDEFKLHLIFAGAKNSLFVHHQSKLVQLKGDRISLGGQQHMEDIRFTNQKMILDDGDTLYLTTDGYIDAANEYREKIGMQRFQALLNDHVHLPMVEQGDRLHEVLNTHQRGTTQRDDITIVGVKV